MAGAWRAVLLLLPKQSLSSTRYQSNSSRALSSSSATATGTSRPPKGSCQIYEDDQLAINTGELPLPVWNTMQKLRAAGHTVLLVGGAVRDLLLGAAPKDWDLLTSAHLAEVKQLVPKSSVFGRNFPICQLLVQGVRVEVSSMHTRPHSSSSTRGHATGSGGVPPDAAQILQAGPKAAAAAAAAAAGGAQIGRHRRSRLTSHHHSQQQQQQPPPQLSWAAARRENALGRDFTVNCLMYDPFAGLLFDYVQGVPDIHAGILRCNGDPASRFSRDPACMLRAVRCAARAGLTLEQHTQAALQHHGHLLHTINTHRMTAELMALLGYGAAAASVQLLTETWLLQHVLPLHASYMHRHVQARSTHSIVSRQGIAAAPDGGVSTHKDCSEQSSSSRSSCRSPAAATSQLPCSEQSPCDTEQQALSALGVLWNTAPCQQQQQLQQQQQQQLRQQRQSLDQANLLLRVLAALDQHVSVSQPAQPEVVLSCLTLPLLVEVLIEAVILLLQQQQQQQQHQMQQMQMQQQHRYQQHAMLAEDSAAAAAVASRELCQPQQHLFEGALSLNHAGADSTLLLRAAAPTARSTARPFSSSSSSSHPEGLQFACSSRSLAHEFVQQLLQGIHLQECIRQQAAHLAAMVCQPSAVNGESSQEPTHPFNQLFGVHTPKLAADLLLAGQLQRCKQQPPGTAPEQQAPQHAAQDSKHTTSSRCGTRQQLRQQPSHLDLWDEYAAALPRSNKQFRRLMQRQWDQQLPGAEAGFMGTLAPQEVLLAAADAGSAADHRPAGSNSDRHYQQQATGVDSSQLLQRVLETASVNLGEMEEQLQAALVHVHG